VRTYGGCHVEQNQSATDKFALAQEQFDFLREFDAAVISGHAFSIYAGLIGSRLGIGKSGRLRVATDAVDAGGRQRIAECDDHLVIRAGLRGPGGVAVGVVKPDPRIYEILFARAGRKPHELLFIDDSGANVRAGEALGMATIHFRPGVDLEAELKTRGALP
jgi:HAD-hyrolase-like